MRDLALKLDIRFEDSHSQGPRLDNLFFVIVNRKNWVSFPDKQGYLNGKVSALLHWNTKVLIDDKLEICTECSSFGVLCYHLSTSSSNIFRPRPLWELGHSSHTFPSFEAAAYQIVNDLFTGELQRKLQALNRVAQRYKVPNYAGD